MIEPLLRTDGRDWAPAVMRLALGAVIFAHGAQKLLGWYGGRGWNDAMSVLTQNVGLPAAVAALVILVESLGALSLLLGFLTRACAFGLTLVMLGAIRVHAENGFFMDWYGTQRGEGFEFHLLAIGLGLALTITGGGRGSIDARLVSNGRKSG